MPPYHGCMSDWEDVSVTEPTFTMHWSTPAELVANLRSDTAVGGDGGGSSEWSVQQAIAFVGGLALLEALLLAVAYRMGCRSGQGVR